MVTTRTKTRHRTVAVLATLLVSGIGAPALAGAAPSVALSKATVAPAASTTARPTLKLGSTGAAVSDLQYRLRMQGYTAIATGYYGTMTRDAVAAFQRAHHLAADGVCGTRTWAAVMGSTRDVVSPQRPTLHPGQRGEPVVQLQRALNDWGTLGRVKVDGYFGASTTTAVKAFQRQVAIPVDGVVGPRTWSMLMSGLGRD